MNTVIVLRLLGDHQAISYLQTRLELEKSIIQEKNDPGAPFVIREIERALEDLQKKSNLSNPDN